ncbi:MAG: LacI family DNA-binding transcriptional regulator [Candidatus Dormiibacterota bacterium]
MGEKSSPDNPMSSGRRGPGSRPSIRDVAQLAGVSVTTVSQALSGKRPVKRSTVGRVRRAVAELGYQPDPVAQAMITGRLSALGLVLPDIVNPFFPLVARGAEDAAAEAGYSLIIANTDLRLDRELQCIATLVAQRVAGILFMPGAPEALMTMEYLRSSTVPFVLMDESLEGEAGSGVFSDNADGGYQAGRHLAGRGCRRLVYMGGPPQLPSVREREAGFARALTETDAELVTSRYGPYRGESGYELTSELLASGVEFDGLFAADDLIALGAMQALHQAGLQIPDDVAVCGFDGIAGTELWSPSLTTVVQASYSLGTTAAGLLLRYLLDESEGIPRVVLPVSLVARASTGSSPLQFREAAPQQEPRRRGRRSQQTSGRPRPGAGRSPALAG